jgi:hypothetical protein
MGYTLVTPACGRMPFLPGLRDADYAHADSKELRDCIAAYMASYGVRRNEFSSLSFLIGAEKAVLAGETEVDRINDREVDEEEADLRRLHPAPIAH